jgi:hypothetical protein
MKDLRKGMFILLLGVIASISAFTLEDRRWEMAFINFDTESSNQINEIDALQAQLLAGVDPTTISEATAAGGVSSKLSFNCSNGKIIRDNAADSFHNAIYTSIKHTDGSYIELQDSESFLFKTAFETQSATLLESLPNDISEQMILASQMDSCSKIDMYLAKIKNI